jgi:Cys-tRNA(Pro) deacylase
MAKEKFPVTPGVRMLRQHGIAYGEHLYDYEEHGGTRRSAELLQVPEHSVIKTLVMQDDRGQVLLVLMHGDREVSTQALARQLGRRSIAPCKPELATKHTGYLFGGTSPFGLRSPLPIYVEATILDLSRIYINAGKRGCLVSLSPQDLVRVLSPTPVQVATA